MTGNKVFVAVLAAGLSRRFGSPKQLQHWHGKPLVRHALETATAACDEHVLLILGHEWPQVLAAAVRVPFVVLNDDYKLGMGTSIAAAARTLRGRADAVIIMPVDQPLLAAAHLRALVSAWSGAANEIVATHYEGIDGIPALFAADTFDSLASLDSHRGARVLFADKRFRIQSVACPEAAFDVDAPADLEQRSQLTQPESPST